MSTRRTFLAAALATPVLVATVPLSLAGMATDIHAVPAPEPEALAAVVALLHLTEASQAALTPDAAQALSEALLYALKYDQAISWLAASCVAAVPWDGGLLEARMAGLLDLLHARLEARAITLHL